MIEQITQHLLKEIKTEVSAQIHNLFERYLEDPKDKKQIEGYVQKSEGERDSFWERMWKQTLETGKSYMDRFLPEVKVVTDLVEKGKDLLQYDIAGFLKSFTQKDILTYLPIPESFIQKIIEVCITTPFFLEALTQHNPELAQKLKTEKKLEDFIEAIKTLIGKGISEYKISEMIKPMLIERVPFLKDILPQK